MRYFGGKSRISKPLAEFLNSQLSEGQTFVDAFCGSCNVVSKIDPNRLRIANDLHMPLIGLWKALQDGWIPPENVSEEMYKEIRHGDYPDYLKAFVGFGCSYSGKWWGGYARGGEARNYASNAKNTLLKKFSNLQDVSFCNKNYQDLDIPKGSLVYCDIPYLNTTGYSTGNFNHHEFWEWCKSQPNKVLVSEYLKNVPEGARVVWTHQSRKDIRNSQGVQEKTTEVLYTFD